MKVGAPSSLLCLGDGAQVVPITQQTNVLLQIGVGHILSLKPLFWPNETAVLSKDFPGGSGRITPSQCGIPNTAEIHLNRPARWGGCGFENFYHKTQLPSSVESDILRYLLYQALMPSSGSLSK